MAIAPQYTAEELDRMSVAIMRSALPAELAEDARADFLKTSFTLAPWEERDLFAKQFPNGGFGIPGPDEIYTTSFQSCNYSKLPAVVRALEHIMPKVNKHAGKDGKISLLNCYKLYAGDYLRIHRDNYAGHVGFVWHLSKDWKWDWGGLLLAISGERASAVLPEFNSLVLLDHASGLPHCVTQVAQYAKEPRMMVTGIVRPA